MPLLVTSAFGVNGDGYGALLAFDRNGMPLGRFCDDPRIADPRGLAVHQHEKLLYLNSSQDRVLAIEAGGTIVIWRLRNFAEECQRAQESAVDPLTRRELEEFKKLFRQSALTLESAREIERR
jgi:hypothetical protein